MQSCWLDICIIIIIRKCIILPIIIIIQYDDKVRLLIPPLQVYLIAELPGQHHWVEAVADREGEVVEVFSYSQHTPTELAEWYEGTGAVLQMWRVEYTRLDCRTIYVKENIDNLPHNKTWSSVSNSS